MRRLTLLLPLGLALGCATETSTFTGSLATESFPAAPTSVVAVASDASETLAVVDASGAFSLELPTEETYTLFVETADGRVPIGLRPTDDSFGTVLSLGMGSATVDLGELTWVTTFTVRADVEAPEAPETPSIDEAADVVCEDAEAASAGVHGGKGKHGGKRKHGGGDVVTDIPLDAPVFVLPTYALELRVGCGC